MTTYQLRHEILALDEQVRRPEDIHRVFAVAARAGIFIEMNPSSIIARVPRSLEGAPEFYSKVAVSDDARRHPFRVTTLTLDAVIAAANFIINVRGWVL